jgi:hypothetical protein
VIKALADSGELTDPEAIGRILQTKIVHLKHWAGPVGECKEPSSLQTVEGDAYAAADLPWYKSRSDGVPTSLIREQFGSAFVTGDPTFSYSISKMTHCSGSYAVEPEFYAELRFEYLTRFTCITAETLKSELPEIERAENTIAPAPYMYRGKSTEDYGVLVNFGEVSPPECVIGVLIWQDWRWGNRTRRAYLKH